MLNVQPLLKNRFLKAKEHMEILTDTDSINKKTIQFLRFIAILLLLWWLVCFLEEVLLFFSYLYIGLSRTTPGRAGGIYIARMLNILLLWICKAGVIFYLFKKGDYITRYLGKQYLRLKLTDIVSFLLVRSIGIILLVNLFIQGVKFFIKIITLLYLTQFSGKVLTDVMSEIWDIAAGGLLTGFIFKLLELTFYVIWAWYFMTKAEFVISVISEKKRKS